MAQIRVVEFHREFRADKAVDWVLLAPVGEAYERCKTWHRVERLRPEPNPDTERRESLTYIDMCEKWEAIGPAYEAWKSGQEIPEQGTPLAAWNGVTPDQAQIMRGMGIRTVEDVRDMPESAQAKLPFPDVRRLPQLALEFLEGSDAAAKDAEIASMKEKMAAMEEMLNERSAQATEETKRKPGRPPKHEKAAS